MSNKITPGHEAAEACAGRITFCPNGIVHFDYGSVTLHFTALGFLKLMAAGQVAAEKIREAMQGAPETGVVH